MAIPKEQIDLEEELRSRDKLIHQHGVRVGYREGYKKGFEKGYQTHKDSVKPAISDGLRLGSKECGKALNAFKK